MSNNDKHFYFRVIAIICLVAGIAFIGVTTYRNSVSEDTDMIYADKTLLANMWDKYKTTYWESDTGRTLDNQQNYITTSEGQSYTMLRSVWMNDQATFDKAWTWTKQQLMHSDDKLFAWRWGEKSNGSYGVLTDQGGQNSASDADVDIAFALLMASKKWNDVAYRTEATAIIASIWDEEVTVIQGKPYLLANDLEKTSGSATAIINPSYYAPYAFRAFAKVDKAHDWRLLADTTYETLNAVTNKPLDVGKSVNLPPDWAVVNKASGEITAPNVANLTTNFSYDANRTVWRIALDYMWSQDKRAKVLLSKFSYLADSYERDGKLFSTYSHDGKIITRDEVPAMYGTTLGYFMVQNPKLAATIYNDKLKATYSNGTNDSNTVSYYSDNWAWFGMALINDELPNLTQDL